MSSYALIQLQALQIIRRRVKKTELRCENVAAVVKLEGGQLWEGRWEGFCRMVGAPNYYLKILNCKCQKMTKRKMK